MEKMFSKLRRSTKFSKVHNKLGTAGLVVAIVALVAALTGVAFAAAGLNSKQKKEVKNIAKQFAGKNGAPGGTGPAGPKGDQGAKGDTGEKGAKGDTGATGQAGMCSEENPECKLASGATLTGEFGAFTTKTGTLSGSSLASISFPVRVQPAPTALYQGKIGPFSVGQKLEDGNASVYPHPIEEFSVEEFEALQAAFEEVCPGNFDEPEAASSFLCIYTGAAEGMMVAPNGLPSLDEAANEFGIDLPYQFELEGTNTPGSATLRGSWAVTG